MRRCSVGRLATHAGMGRHGAVELIWKVGSKSIASEWRDCVIQRPVIIETNRSLPAGFVQSLDTGVGESESHRVSRAQHLLKLTAAIAEPHDGVFRYTSGLLAVDVNNQSNPESIRGACLRQPYLGKASGSGSDRGTQGFQHRLSPGQQGHSKRNVVSAGGTSQRLEHNRDFPHAGRPDITSMLTEIVIPC